MKTIQIDEIVRIYETCGLPCEVNYSIRRTSTQKLLRTALHQKILSNSGKVYV